MDRKRSPIPPPREPPPRRELQRNPHSMRDPRGGDPYRDQPPPPPREYRGMDYRGDPRDMDRRRGRSRSPVYDRYARGRASPPYRRNVEQYPDRYGRGQSPGYRGRSPARGGYDDREYFEDDRRGPAGRGPRAPPEEARHRPMSFKEFLLEQPDDPSPDEAQARYKAYLIEWHGGEIKAEFAEKKNDERMRAMFDPRMFEKALAKRNEDARASVQTFAADIEQGKLDPKADNFNQGMLDLAVLPEAPAAAAAAAAPMETDEAKVKVEGEGDAKPAAAAGAAAEAEGPKPIFAPPLTWQASRIAHDLALCRTLIKQLEAEKGIAANPLLPAKAENGAVPDAAAPAPPAAAPEQPAAAAPAANDGPKSMEQDAPATADGDQAPAEPADTAAAAADVAPAASDAAAAAASGGAAQQQPQQQQQQQQQQQVEEFTLVDELNLQEATGRLDLYLTYLWRVHGVDYYAGYELTAEEFPQRLAACRMLRCAKPEEGEEDAEADKQAAEALAKTVDETWQRRMQEGDPLELRCQRKRIEDGLEKWIEGQLVSHDNGTKWGSKLSTKLFVGKKFVVKHIKLKHEDKLNAEKERLYDEMYFENFKAFKEEEAKVMEAQQRQQPHEGEAEQELGQEQNGEGFEEEFAGDGFEGGAHFRGRGGMRGGPRFMGRGMRGRGPRMISGMGMGMGMMEAPMMMQMPMAGMGGMTPMFMPAPGAGPMGPFLPIIPAGAGTIMPMMGMRPMGRGGRYGSGMRGGRGGRGFGGAGYMMAGPGAKLDPAGIREYYDLDNPQNNRAVLDYGDL